MATDLPRPEVSPTGSAPPAAGVATLSTEWRQTLPVLNNHRATVRELVPEDAESLLAMLGTDEVARFISPLPSTTADFERFVKWTHQQRAAGQYVGFAVVPTGLANPVGLFQVRSLESGFATAEWGFALAPPFWGRGLFVEAAWLVLDFVFGTIRVRRLEARASVHNLRGNGALRKLGATPEGVLRRSFLCGGQHHDQVLWSILDSDWRNAKAASGAGGLVTGAALSE